MSRSWTNLLITSPRRWPRVTLKSRPLRRIWIVNMYTTREICITWRIWITEVASGRAILGFYGTQRAGAGGSPRVTISVVLHRPELPSTICVPVFTRWIIKTLLCGKTHPGIFSSPRLSHCWRIRRRIWITERSEGTSTRRLPRRGGRGTRLLPRITRSIILHRIKQVTNENIPILTFWIIQTPLCGVCIGALSTWRVQTCGRLRGGSRSSSSNSSASRRPGTSRLVCCSRSRRNISRVFPTRRLLRHIRHLLQRTYTLLLR